MTEQLIGESLWAEFRSNLKTFLASARGEDFSEAWATHTNRTKFYRTIALQQVARSMGYEFGNELYKVDFVMLKQVDSQKVPFIFVESENAVRSAGHEISKLCCIAAPLRVLITVVEWDETGGVWSSGGQRARLVEEWGSIIRAYNRAWPRPGVIGVVVGEWRRDNVLRFYATQSNPEGEFGEDEVLLERSMTKPAHPPLEAGQ